MSNQHLVIVVSRTRVHASTNLIQAQKIHDGTFDSIADVTAKLSKLFAYKTIETIFDTEDK